jgi:hypothetical protein
VNVNDNGVKQWTTICQLTNPAMDALVVVEQALMAVDSSDLTPLEFRALMWVRCSLASLYGVRADEIVSDAALLEDLLATSDRGWSDELSLD